MGNTYSSFFKKEKKPDESTALLLPHNIQQENTATITICPENKKNRSLINILTVDRIISSFLQNESTRSLRLVSKNLYAVVNDIYFGAPTNLFLLLNKIEKLGLMDHVCTVQENSSSKCFRKTATLSPLNTTHFPIALTNEASKTAIVAFLYAVANQLAAPLNWRYDYSLYFNRGIVLISIIIFILALFLIPTSVLLMANHLELSCNIIPPTNKYRNVLTASINTTIEKWINETHANTTINNIIHFCRYETGGYCLGIQNRRANEGFIPSVDANVICSDKMDLNFLIASTGVIVALFSLMIIRLKMNNNITHAVLDNLEKRVNFTLQKIELEESDASLDGLQTLFSEAPTAETEEGEIMTITTP